MRSNQAFRGEAAVPVGLDLPKVPTHRMMLEKLQELFPEMVEGVQWDLADRNGIKECLGLPGEPPCR